MSSSDQVPVSRRPRHRRSAVAAVLGAVVLGVGLIASSAEAAAPVSGDPRATAFAGSISSCPAGTTLLLQNTGGFTGSNALVQTTNSSGGKFITLTFANSLTGAGVLAFIKGANAYNQYVITVGTSDTTLLHSPLKGGNIPQISHFLICQSSAPPPPPQFDEPPAIWLGYADDFHGVPGSPTAFKPSPWKGDTGVVFLGCQGISDCGGSGTGKYDSGAIRVDNADGDTPLKLVGARVEIGPCLYEIWTDYLPATAAPGGKLILTQTGEKGHKLPFPCAAAVDPLFHIETNFDTSERPGDTREPKSYNCNPEVRLTPVITLTFEDGAPGSAGDVPLTINDTGRVLNTGGVDSFACQGIDEARIWTGPIFYTLP